MLPPTLDCRGPDVLKHLRRFPRARAGNAVLIFALVMPVLLMAIGGAIDFGRAVQLRVAMQDAADVASLGAVAINSAAYKVALQMGDGEITAGTQQAHDIYVSDMISAPELSTPIIATQVSKSGTVLTSNVSVSANYKPYLLQLFGFATLPLSVTSKSSSTIPTGSCASTQSSRRTAPPLMARPVTARPPGARQTGTASHGRAGRRRAHCRAACRCAGRTRTTAPLRPARHLRPPRSVARSSPR